MRIALIAVALSLPASANAATPTITDALQAEQRLSEAEASHDPASLRAALAAAARIPWPLLAPSVDRLLAQDRGDLDPATREAWALDRALPILAGELKASDSVLKDVLGDVAKATRTDPRRPNDMARLEQARRAYAVRELALAESRYASVTQGSPLWPEALRERAWTLLLLGHPDDSLGATVALGAPYFPREDRAEGRLLRATVLLSRCRYAEARQIVQALADAPIPSLSESEAQVAIAQGIAPAGPVAARAWSSPLVDRVLTVLAASRHARLNVAAVDRRTALITLGTRLLESAFADEAEQLRRLKERALKVRYQSFRDERQILERGETLSAPVPAPPGPIGDDQVVWDFDGTYWRDELGSYRYFAGNACPSGVGR